MRYTFLLLALFAPVLYGCGSSGPFDYVPVSGRVAFDDGSALPGGFKMIFVPLDVASVGTAHPRPARASVDEQGEFDCVTSYKYGDGLIPGKHKVVLQVGPGSDGKAIVPRVYTSSETTPLVVDTADAPFEILIPKP